MKLILFQAVDWRKTIPMVVAATRSKEPQWCVKRMEDFAKTLTGVWWRMNGQMCLILAGSSKSFDDLHVDMTCVLIGGHK